MQNRGMAGLVLLSTLLSILAIAVITVQPVGAQYPIIRVSDYPLPRVSQLWSFATTPDTWDQNASVHVLIVKYDEKGRLPVVTGIHPYGSSNTKVYQVN